MQHITAVNRIAYITRYNDIYNDIANIILGIYFKQFW